GAGLQDVDHELVMVFTVEDLLGGRHDGVGAFGGHCAQVAISLSRCHLDGSDGADESGVSAHAADGKVADGAGSLRAVKGIGRKIDGAEGVFFCTGFHVGSAGPYYRLWACEYPHLGVAEIWGTQI